MFRLVVASTVAVALCWASATDGVVSGLARPVFAGPGLTDAGQAINQSIHRAIHQAVSQAVNPSLPDDLAAGSPQGPTLRGLAIASEYDALHIPDAAALSPASQLAIELWTKRTAFKGCGTLVSKGRADSYWFGVCDGRLRLSIGGIGVDGNALLPEGRWVHVAASFDGATASLYVNGTLDKSLLLSGARLVTNHNDLVIGADTLFGALFPGGIDELRLWRVTRSADDLSSNWLKRLPPQAGLVAEWALDGNGIDLVGGHNGRAGSGSFSVDGRLPSDLKVPLTNTTMAVDGRCDAVEYGAAERVVVEGVEAPVAMIQASANQLFVCIADVPKETSGNAFLAVYLDRNFSRDATVQPGDLRFKMSYTGNPVVEEQDATHTWKTITTLPVANWEAARTTTNERYTVELRVSRSLIDIPQNPQDPQVAGIAIAHAGVRGQGDDYYWPASAIGDVPASWSAATFNDALGPAASSRFTGRVQRLRGDGTVEGLFGTQLQLFAADVNSLRLVDSDVTDGNGAFELQYSGPAPERFVVRRLESRGMVAVSAEAGANGRPVGTSSVLYVRDTQTDGDGGRIPKVITDDALRFVDRLGPAPVTRLADRYLIVYAPPVTEDDLALLVAAKEAEGFQVVLKSTLELGRAGAGRDLAEKLHLWLRDTYEAVKDDKIGLYLLLVGRGDVIPVRDVGWLGNDHRQPGSSTYYPAWPTDMYYADVDSDWDADGDGYYGEFLTCPPGSQYWDNAALIDCPEQGSLLRGGPYGELRGASDDFRAEIAVGRLPLNEPASVRRAIAAMVAAQKQPGAERRRVIAAAGFWSFAGQSWSEALKLTASGGAAAADPWLSMPWTGQQPLGRDAAEAFESDLLARLGGLPLDVQKLYETTNPDGDPSHSPSRFVQAQPLSDAAVAQMWPGGIGALLGAGRGSSAGLYSASWRHDWDANGRIDQPAKPIACSGKAVDDNQVGAPCWELLPYRFLGADLPRSAGSPPLVAAMGGHTGAVAWRWDGVDAGGHVNQLSYGPGGAGATLLSQGRVSAWLGLFGGIAPGTLDHFQARFTELAMVQGLRLGDAHALASAELIAGHSYDPRAYGTVLFGDPAAGYWGQPADNEGAWAQDAGGWMATGTSPYQGPAVPELAWTAGNAGLTGPVAVARTGGVMGTAASSVEGFSPSGVLRLQANLGVPALGAARSVALATSATYVAEGGAVYAFGAGLTDRRVLALPTGALASGAPRVGPDGMVWVPTQLGLSRLSHGGRADLVTNESVRGPVAFRLRGEVVLTTSFGDVVAVKGTPDGLFVKTVLTSRALRDATAPVVGADGTVYAGSSDGRVYAFPQEGSSWRLEVGSGVQLRPAVAPSGEVYAADAKSEVKAFGARGAEALWTARLSGNAVAGPTVDGLHVFVVVGSDLIAIERATGLVDWTLGLGGQGDARSTPVLGADRTLYVTRADGALVAVRQVGWLAAPTEVSLTADSSGTVVRWRDNATEEVGYAVLLCDLDERCQDAGTASANSEALALSRLPWVVGTPFYVRVQAVGRAAPPAEPGEPPVAVRSAAVAVNSGDVSMRSATASMRPAADSTESSDWVRSNLAMVPGGPPSTPSGLVARTLRADAIGLDWRYIGDGSELLGFTLSRRTGASTGWQVVAALGPEARTFSDGELQADQSYDYQLTAQTAVGPTGPTVATTSTLKLTLQPVANLHANSKPQGVLLEWRDPNPASELAALHRTGALVERLDEGDASWRVLAELGAAENQFLDHFELLPGRTYYRVRLIADAGESPTTTLGHDFAPNGKMPPIYMPVAYRAYRRR